MGAVVTPAAQREFAFNRSDFEKVRKTLMSQAGIRLADSKDGMVYSRLARRLRALNMDSFNEYLPMWRPPPTSRNNSLMP